MRIDVLFSGFPGQSDRGFLGWSSCVLIRPDQGGPILFDTAGFNERYVLIQKFQDLGVKLEDVEIVFLSHYHFDHAANVSLFPKAKVFLHEKEIVHIKKCQKGIFNDLAVPHEMFKVLEESGRMCVLKGLSGYINQFEWRLTPGHTPGLCSMLLKMGNKKWVLASDAVKNKTELATGHASMSLDDEASAKSISWIRENADVVVPGHDGILNLQRGNESNLSIQKSRTPVIKITSPEQIIVKVNDNG